jgi:uncharacterized protein YndB with AHSA1/START domain
MTGSGAAKPTAAVPGVDVTIIIKATPGRVLGAFFDPVSLGAWWQASRSITIPRTLGPYVVEWPVTDFRDAVLGRLGGIFSGTVMDLDPDRGFFVANAYWLPPESDPIGPMALEVTCTAVASANDVDGPTSKLRVTQKGYDDSVRWKRYYDVVGSGWARALTTLKNLVEP